MVKSKITEFDKFFGERIREARLTLEMSQVELGGLLGVSFQQVQKYETGKNRVSSGRLKLLGTALNKPMSFFFPNPTDIRTTADPIISQMLSTAKGIEMARKFSRLHTSGQRLVLQVVDELLSKEQ